MYGDDVTKVEITNIGGLDVELSGRSSVAIDGIDGLVSVETKSRFYLVDIKKPYLINLNQIECVVGEWDKDKTTYGVRIFFASGNSVWCGGESARKILERLDGDNRATAKFDTASKR